MSLNRLLTLIPYLRANPGVHVAEVARHLATTEDEVMDLVNQILMCGVPPYYPNDYVSVRNDGGRLTVLFADQFSRPVGFTLKEVAVLRMVLDATANDAASDDVRERLQSVRERLEELYRPPAATTAARPDLDQAGRIEIRGTQERVRERARALESAANDHRTVEIEHFSTSRDALHSRAVDPYGLVQEGSHLYCVAFDHERGRELTFRLDRVRSVSLTDRTFEPPAGDRLDELLAVPVTPKGARGRKARRFEVKLSAAAAHLAREYWDRRSFSEQPDGTVRFTAPLHDENFPCVFALPMGADAEILGPPEVRARMRDRLDRAIADLEADIANANANASGSSSRD